jgi:Phage derived protein Gp49-like (DUF891)
VAIAAMRHILQKGSDSLKKTEEIYVRHRPNILISVSTPEGRSLSKFNVSGDHHVQYRILYFFYGQNVAILAHAITKNTDQVPVEEIERAMKRKQLFEENPKIHTYVEEVENGKD